MSKHSADKSDYASITCTKATTTTTTPIQSTQCKCKRSDQSKKVDGVAKTRCNGENCINANDGNGNVQIESFEWTAPKETRYTH